MIARRYTWALTGLTAQALTHAIGHRAPMPGGFQHVILENVRRAGLIAEPLLARGSRRFAIWYADRLSTCNLPRTAARVRLVNDLAPVA